MQAQQRTLDAEVVALRVPEHLDVGHVEQLLLAHLAAAGDGPERHAGGRVARVLLRLVHRQNSLGGRPQKVGHALQLQRLLVQQRHVGRLVDGHRVLANLGEVLVLGTAGPLEDGPREAGAATAGACGAGQQEVLQAAGEAAQLASGAHVEEGNVDGDRLARVGRLRHAAGCDVLLARRVLQELHARVLHARQAREAGPAPQRNALPVHRGDVVAARRPLHVRLRPVAAAVHLVRPLGVRVVPVQLRLVRKARRKLVAPARVQQPGHQVLARRKRLGLRRRVRLRHGRKLGKVVHHVHLQRRAIGATRVRVGPACQRAAAQWWPSAARGAARAAAGRAP